MRTQHLITKMLLSLTILLLVSCIGCKNKDNGKIPDVPVNPEFSSNPPIASEVYLKKIKGDSTRAIVIARFDNKVFNQPFLAMNAGGKKVVFRDDGLGEDEKKADGLYTAVVNGNVNEFQKLINKRIRSMPDSGFMHFVNRSMEFTASKPAEIDLTASTQVLIPDEIFFPPYSAIDIYSKIKSHSLMVTNLSVVEDPARTWNNCRGLGEEFGAWTFAHLMKEMAQTDASTEPDDAALSSFILSWLAHWESDQTINGDVVAARVNPATGATIRTLIIDPWLASSRTNGKPKGVLDMSECPFKLTAIVNRLDLRGNSSYFSNDDQNWGELRFVYCLADCNPDLEEFNVIFEYGINVKDCDEFIAYAQSWQDLIKFDLGSAEYLQALENITRRFTEFGGNADKVNQNCINQIRTNEVEIVFDGDLTTDPGWELREFYLHPTTHMLAEKTVRQEPESIYNTKSSTAEVQRLAEYVNSRTFTIILGLGYEVPETYTDPDGSTHPMLGGNAMPVFPPSGPVASSGVYHWDGGAVSPYSITNTSARHIFSLNTCSGCHTGEAQAFFTHVDPAPFNTEAGLSGFLTGRPGRPLPPSAQTPEDADGITTNRIMTVNDPSRRTTDQYQYNDLTRRAQDLIELISSGDCTSELFMVLQNLFFNPIHSAC